MARRWCFLLFLLTLWPARGRAEDTPPARWVVVTAPAFRAAVEPLCRHRAAEGMRVQVVQTTDVLSAKEITAGEARKLQEHVHQLCREAKGACYVLLVGAVEAGRLADADQKVMPALPGTVSRMKGQPSDNGYGCPGEGLLPTVAVGRFPVRTAEEARHLVQKTLAYERDDRPGEWRRQVTILAGAPMYNPTVDALVERLAIHRLSRVDPSWSGRVLYHNPQSRFCVPDDDLHDRALRYVQAGQALTLYLGHSNAQGFGSGQATYLGRDDWARLAIARGPGVFATFGCHGCQLAGELGEGYGVAAVRNPRGPVAVLGSHGECFAAMVELAADGLVQSFFAARPPQRLGECWLRLQTSLAQGYLNPLTFPVLDAVDGDRTIPPAMQRLEHLEMFVLLGDPALRLPAIPADVRLTTAEAARPGQALTVRGEVPARLEGARVRVTVERPLTSEPVDLEPVPKGPAAARALTANHERANTFALATQEATIRDGRFAARLELPARLPWPRLTLRAYAATARHEALGVLPLPVQKSAP